MNIALPDPTAVAASTNDNADGQAEDEECESDEERDDEGINPAEEDNNAMAVHCKDCQTWLNVPRQSEDHKIGKKHPKNVQKARRGAAAGSNDHVPAEVEPVQPPEGPPPDPVPEKITDTWLWLENAKADKLAAKAAEK